jgi:polyisoprenoid-binding protein YceI
MLSAILLVLGPFGCPSEPEPKKAQEQEIDEPAERAKPEGADSRGAVAQPSEPPAKDPQPKVPQQLTADVAQSKILFLVTRAVGEHLGRFEKFSATLELTDEQPSKLEIAVKTGSVVADREGLTSHLKSAEFFDVDKFPTAIFTTDTITPIADEEPNTYTVTGTMRLHGISGKLEFPATITVEPTRVHGRATVDISAKAFGIDYAGMEAELADDAVGLSIELVFPR